MEVRLSVASSFYRDTDSISRGLPSCPNPYIISQRLCFNLIWWLSSVVPVLRRLRQEDCNRSWANTYIAMPPTL